MAKKPSAQGGRGGRVTDNEAVQAFLAALGARVRDARVTRGMTRRILARDSGVSERYLAQLETGKGNPSVAVLHHIADAMGCALSDLVGEPDPAVGDVAGIVAILNGLDANQLQDIETFLDDRFAGESADDRGRRISLIGLRGAGKSTLGQRLAADMGCPFIELNRLIEREYGASIGELLALSGQPALRRYERRCLEAVIRDHEHAVIATGGGIVSDRGTFGLLRARSHCIWLKARPEEHMDRVLAQGDLRPMAQNKEAMADLRSILKAREPFYRQAQAVVDTGGRQEDACAADLLDAARRLMGVS